MSNLSCRGNKNKWINWFSGNYLQIRPFWGFYLVTGGPQTVKYQPFQFAAFEVLRGAFVC